MRTLIMVYTAALLLSVCSFSYAQTVAVEPTAVTQTVEASVPTVPVAEPAAPPEWAEKLIVVAQDLPVIGPVLSKILVYLGVISAILTSLIAFLLTTISALSKILNLAGLVNLAVKLQTFRDGRIMYWLKFASLFNAKKPEQKTKAAA